MIQKTVTINQNVAILIDGNNIEIEIHKLMKNDNSMLNFDTFIPKILKDRSLNRLIYFREGKHISKKLSERLDSQFHGSCKPCYKSADIPLTITAMQLASKVDTIIILSGDKDYIELIRHLKTEGVRVEIASLKSSTALMIKNEADYFTEISKEDCFVFKTKVKSPIVKKVVQPKETITNQETITPIISQEEQK